MGFAHPIGVMKLLAMGVVAIILHELSHILMAWAYGLKIKRIGLSWKGFYVVREPGTPQVNFDVSLAGPLGNLVLAAVFGSMAPTFGLANLVIGGFNLLPIPSSDGDRALQLVSEGALLPERKPPESMRMLPGRENKSA